MPSDRIRAQKLAQAAAAAARREAVLRRLAYHDWSEAELRTSLDWPSGIGVGAVLRELRERGEAHEHEDRWLIGPPPTPEEAMELAKRLEALVAQKPGLNASELARELGVHAARIGQVAHLAAVRAEKQGEHRGAATLYFPANPSSARPPGEVSPASGEAQGTDAPAGPGSLVDWSSIERDALVRQLAEAHEDLARARAELDAVRATFGGGPPAPLLAMAQGAALERQHLHERAATLKLELDAAAARADRADQYIGQLGTLLDRYDVPASLRLSYVETALKHRSRCSAWLAQIDHALGSDCDRTQADSPEGEAAQAWRLAQIAALRPTQPPPSGGEGDCWQELIDSVGPDHPLRAAMVARRELGIARYGQPLRRGDGRDAARDLQEELLDAVGYAQRLTQYGLPLRLLAIAEDPLKWLGTQIGLDVQAGHLRTVEKELRRHLGITEDVPFTESELVDAIGELAAGSMAPSDDEECVPTALLVEVLNNAEVGQPGHPLLFRLGLLAAAITPRSQS